MVMGTSYSVFVLNAPNERVPDSIYRMVYMHPPQRTPECATGSALLDSFYLPVETTICLQDKPVVDVETICKDKKDMSAYIQPRSAQRYEEAKAAQPRTSRKIAVDRIRETLKLDRAALE